MSESFPHVTLRPATLTDSRRLWEWRNEPSVRAASFQSAPIPFEDHERWFEEKLASPHTCIFLVLAGDGREIGYVRFDLEGTEAQISTAIAREVRGRGYGPAAIRAAVNVFKERRGTNRIVALVRGDNLRSELAFARAGFVRTGSRLVGDAVATAMVWPEAGG